MTMKLPDIDKEYKKFQELKKDDVLYLMDWCKQQPHLPDLNGNKIDGLAIPL